MIQFITARLQEVAFQPIGFIFALMLGCISAILSACCTIPSLGMIVGYSGARKTDNRKDLYLTTLFFMFGTVIAFMIMGIIASFIGQVAQNTLGKYWKLFAGFVSIFLGLMTIDMLPIKFSFNKSNKLQALNGMLGTFLSGLVLGGFVAISCLPCNPGIFIVISVSILKGRIGWGLVLMIMYGIGFSIPLGALFLGVSLTKVSLMTKKAEQIFRWIFGLILIAAGFYFIITY